MDPMQHVNILESVILKIEYDKIPHFEHERFSSLLISQGYPEKKVQRRTEISTTFSQGRQFIGQNSYDEYRYYDTEMENCFCISELYSFFELKKYSGFEKLEAQFKNIFDPLSNMLVSDSIARIGLRYINKIDARKTQLPLEESVAEPLLSYRGFYRTCIEPKHSDLKMSLCLGQTSFRRGDATINFIFGNPNPNYPAIIVDESENFLLDYDSFSTNVHKEDILSKLTELHNNVKLLFRESVHQNLQGRIKEWT